MSLSSAGTSMRRGTPSDCHTDSNTSTTGGNNQIQTQQPPQQAPQQQQQTPTNTQINTHVSFGEDDSSCDSHTRWGKRPTCRNAIRCRRISAMAFHLTKNNNRQKNISKKYSVFRLSLFSIRYGDMVCFSLSLTAYFFDY